MPSPPLSTSGKRGLSSCLRGCPHASQRGRGAPPRRPVGMEKRSGWPPAPAVVGITARQSHGDSSHPPWRLRLRQNSGDRGLGMFSGARNVAGPGMPIMELLNSKPRADCETARADPETARLMRNEGRPWINVAPYYCMPWRKHLANTLNPAGILPLTPSLSPT